MNSIVSYVSAEPYFVPFEDLEKGELFQLMDSLYPSRWVYMKIDDLNVSFGPGQTGHDNAVCLTTGSLYYIGQDDKLVIPVPKATIEFY